MSIIHRSWPRDVSSWQANRQAATSGSVLNQYFNLDLNQTDNCLWLWIFMKPLNVLGHPTIFICFTIITCCSKLCAKSWIFTINLIFTFLQLGWNLFLVWVWFWSVSNLAAQQTPHLCYSTMLKSFCCHAYSQFYNILSTAHVKSFWLQLIFTRLTSF